MINWSWMINANSFDVDDHGGHDHDHVDDHHDDGDDFDDDEI